MPHETNQTEPPDFIPTFMLKRVLPEPVMWTPRPVYVPPPEQELRPIGKRKEPKNAA